MSVRIAKSAGFCFGVSRAVDLVEQAARSGKKVATLGPIIHNRHVVNRFESLGVRVIEQPEDAVPGETVIIRPTAYPGRYMSGWKNRVWRSSMPPAPLSSAFTALSAGRRKRENCLSSSAPPPIRRWRALPAGVMTAGFLKVPRN